MSHLGQLIYVGIAFLVSWAITFCSMPLLLKLCKIRGLYDIPDERKVHHTNNIPRLGGVTFVPATLIGGVAAVIAISGGNTTEMTTFNLPTILVLIGMFMLYLIGILDDLFGMKASVKFGIQLVVSMLLPCCGLYIDNLHGFLGLHELPLWMGYGLTVFISLLIVNAVNLIDGIDGLASSLSVLALLGFCTFFFLLNIKLTTIYCAALGGSVLAFMYYNLFGNVNKGTKTFMGDTGSLTLGYALAFLAIRFAMLPEPMGREYPFNPPYTAILVSLTLLAVPCFDLIRVALVRLVNGLPIFHPDKRHIHHKCLRAGFSMHTSLMLVIGLQIALSVINFALVKTSFDGLFIPVVDIVLYALFVLWLDYRIKRVGTTA